MSQSKSLSLNVSIDRLRLVAGEAEHFAIWVWNAPYPGGYVHNDSIWPESLTQTWFAWQEMFTTFSWSPSSRSPAAQLALAPTLVVVPAGGSGHGASYGGHLMQQLGIDLWRWLFDGTIQNSLERSQGMAVGLDQPLRLRLEIRDPNLILLPWEIMQPQAGKQAISLSQQLLFSRTTSDVVPLPPPRCDHALNILLVLGEPATNQGADSLNLDREAETLARILANSGPINPNSAGTLVPCQVDTLVMPTPGELISCLENSAYNILFYAGHGKPAPNGGLLFLRPGVTMSGTELAQVLTRYRVTLAVFNSCWGAQSATHNDRPIPRSSLAEVLIHHGVPAVLAMRDAIADDEAISFIEAFAQALAERKSIDQAMAVARQRLLTLYKFNYPAWTLPVLYLHPEFDGQLLDPMEATQIPDDTSTWMGRVALLRALALPTKVWWIRGGVMRVGRGQKNDLVICEPWASEKHAEIICRYVPSDSHPAPRYFLRDHSRWGTLILGSAGWQKVQNDEVPIQSGMQLKFGSSKGQPWEFIVEG